MILDLFGVLLHNLPLYAIILHLVSISFAIEMIQLYKIARLSSIKNGPPILPPNEEEGADLNKSYNINMMGKNNNIKKTFTSQFIKFEKISK